LFYRFEIEKLFDDYLEALNIDATNPKYGAYCQALEGGIKTYQDFIIKALQGKFKNKYSAKDCETLVKTARARLSNIHTMLEIKTQLKELSLYNRKESIFHYFEKFDITENDMLFVKAGYDDFTTKQKKLSGKERI